MLNLSRPCCLQGAFDNKYHVEKLAHNGMLYMHFTLLFISVAILLPNVLFIQAFYQVAILLTLTFKGVSLLRLEHDNPAHAEILKNTFIFNTFVLCQVSHWLLL